MRSRCRLLADPVEVPEPEEKFFIIILIIILIIIHFEKLKNKY